MNEKGHYYPKWEPLIDMAVKKGYGATVTKKTKRKRQQGTSDSRGLGAGKRFGSKGRGCKQASSKGGRTS